MESTNLLAVTELFRFVREMATSDDAPDNPYVSRPLSRNERPHTGYESHVRVYDGVHELEPSSSFQTDACIPLGSDELDEMLARNFLGGRDNMEAASLRDNMNAASYQSDAIIPLARDESDEMLARYLLYVRDGMDVANHRTGAGMPLASDDLNEMLARNLLDNMDGASDGGYDNGDLWRGIMPRGNAEWQDDSVLRACLHVNDNEDGTDLDDLDLDQEAAGMQENGNWLSSDEDDEDGLEEGLAEASSDLVRLSIRRLHRRLSAHSRNLQHDGLGFAENPGDYVDARGFEEVLQQFIDSDDTRKGAPPAGKAIVEGLPTVFVQQKETEHGYAGCAVCKDVFAVNDPAKQLPCLHLYHSECIRPWLCVRNSCPVCRYELPTDDPAYEEQRRIEEDMRGLLGQVPRGAINGSTSSSDDVHGEDTRNTEGHANEELIAMENNEVTLNSSEEGLVQAEGLECERNEPVRAGFSLRGVISSPLFSVVGMVAISCIGNLLIGSFSNRNGGRGRGSARRRPWWPNPFG